MSVHFKCVVHALQNKAFPKCVSHASYPFYLLIFLTFGVRKNSYLALLVYHISLFISYTTVYSPERTSSGFFASRRQRNHKETAKSFYFILLFFMNKMCINNITQRKKLKMVIVCHGALCVQRNEKPSHKYQTRLSIINNQTQTTRIICNYYVNMTLN